MKQLLYICCIIGLFACNGNKQETAQSYTQTPTGLNGIQSSAVNNPAPSSSQTGGNSNALNPAHGAPGHRCDIAVGAPLNPGSAQVAPQQITTTQQAPVNTQMPTVTANKSGQKLNPAHGEPNHRCDLAVGAPLNSAPAKAITSTKPAIQATPPTAEKQSTSPLFNEKGQRLNPAHGLPGHKCEIAVGAVLN